MKKVLALTGIRSDYDLMCDVYKKMSVSKEINFSIIVSGAHMSERYGLTNEIVRADGLMICAELHSLLDSDHPVARAKSAGIQLMGISDILYNEKPDLVLTLGDREEAMVLAVAASYVGIPICHVAGGDRVVGNVDDQIRHAVSKLSHLHLTTNEESKDRLIRMGEQEFRVQNVGNPGIDRLLKAPILTLSEVFTRLGTKLSDNEPFCVLLFHPLSSESEDSGFQMEEILKALTSLNINVILVQPNSDSGSEAVRLAITKYGESKKIFSTPHVPRLEFINILRNASFLIGNSSLGLLEAPALKLPVINVGNRQRSRLHSENVVFAEPKCENIVDLCNRVMYDEKFRLKMVNCSNPYGDGNASKKIVDIIEKLQITNKFKNKDITY